jgi:hypothetical protein
MNVGWSAPATGRVDHLQCPDQRLRVERVTGIEPAFSAWESLQGRAGGLERTNASDFDTVLDAANDLGQPEMPNACPTIPPSPGTQVCDGGQRNVGLARWPIGIPGYRSVGGVRQRANMRSPRQRSGGLVLFARSGVTSPVRYGGVVLPAANPGSRRA